MGMNAPGIIPARKTRSTASPPIKPRKNNARIPRLRLTLGAVFLTDISASFVLFPWLRGSC
jgi:hypothetical protein